VRCDISLLLSESDEGIVVFAARDMAGSLRRFRTSVPTAFRPWRFQVPSVPGISAPRLHLAAVLPGGPRRMFSESKSVSYPLQCGEEVMCQKAHGTCPAPPQEKLLFGCDRKAADRIACFNRHYAEGSGYFANTRWLDEVNRSEETTYYDVVTGKPLFVAPRGRSFDDFVAESAAHGWPSFRDEEVVWDNVRCLANGEAVSVDGTHLGHNLPDESGNRYCINLVCIAGRPVSKD